MKKILGFILDVFIPSRCFSCKAILEFGEYDLCDKCIGEIIYKDYYEANKTHFIFFYNGAIRYLLKRLKYDPKEDMDFILEVFFNLIISSNISDFLCRKFDLIIPVPIHINRFKERGYNQSDFLSYIFSTILNVEMDSDIILRVKNTRFFYNLNKINREKELADAFVIENNAKIFGKSILLIDDIYTTGTTFNFLSNLLLKNGARDVFCISIAHEKSKNWMVE